MNKPKKVVGFAYWVQGVRLYIGIGIVMATLEVWWWARMAFSGSLLTIRLQETYAWFSVVLLASALLIGPACRLLPKFSGKQLLFDARRLLGVGAAWFASLHVLIAYGSQFNFISPLELADSYQTAFALGVGALLVLLAMAFTSFDGAMRGLGVWWFRLHRLVYAAAILALLHMFMVGVHATAIGPLAATGLLALGLLTFHISAVLHQTKRTTIWQVLTIGLTIIALGFVFNYGIQRYIDKNNALFGDHGHNT